METTGIHKAIMDSSIHVIFALGSEKPTSNVVPFHSELGSFQMNLLRTGELFSHEISRVITTSKSALPATQSAAQLIQPTASPKSESAVCTSNKDFCLTALKKGSDKIEITFRGPKSVGWLGFGTGAAMKDSDMVIAWVNSDNSVTISNRYGKE